MTVVFDDRAFYDALNRARKSRNIAWNKVATRAGVGPTTVSSYVRQFEVPGARAKSLSVDNAVKLLAWLGTLDMSSFVVDESVFDDKENH